MDISIVYDNGTGTGDWVIQNQQIGTGLDLQSAVLVSLFSDRLAQPDYQPNDGTNDLRGFWGDTYSPTSWGSRLWQLSRASISNPAATVLAAQNMVSEALQWMIDDGVAASVAPSAVFITSSTLQISVTITRPTGQSQTFAWAWDLLTQGGT